MCKWTCGNDHINIHQQHKKSYSYFLVQNEIGVHRVQRVPATEAMGRLHTSTMSVAVLPEPEEVNN